MADAPRHRRSGTTGLFPQALAQSAATALRPTLTRRSQAEAAIFLQWEAILGPELAKQCRPHSVSFPPHRKKDGTLTIAAPGALAPQLQHMSGLLLERLAICCGYRAIAQIRLLHDGAPLTPPHSAGGSRHRA